MGIGHCNAGTQISTDIVVPNSLEKCGMKCPSNRSQHADSGHDSNCCFAGNRFVNAVLMRPTNGPKSKTQTVRI